jgi:hypothetical protein
MRIQNVQASNSYFPDQVQAVIMPLFAGVRIARSSMASQE